MGDLRYLLDTHTLLWAVREPNKLGKSAKDILSDADNLIYVSKVFCVKKSSLHDFYTFFQK